MDQDEWDQPEANDRLEDRTEACSHCGDRVAPGVERGFRSGISIVLCWRCAVERGGQYDEERNIWTVSPHIADLPDESYGPETSGE